MGLISLGKGPKREMVFLTPDQVSALGDAIGAAHRPFRLLVLFLSYTGLRAGEVAALQVRHLDLIRRSVLVSESLGEVPGMGLVRGETKTGNTRTVPIPRFLVDDLRDQVAGKGPLDPVFTMSRGGPLRQTNVLKRYFRPALIRAGLPVETRMHDLRHTFAAICISEGAHPIAIMQRMGHSSIRVTMDVYGHLFGHLEEELTDKLDALGRGASPAPSAEILDFRNGPTVAVGL